MKEIICLAILAGIIHCAGCVAPSGPSPAPPQYPDLTGNWTGTTEGYTEQGYRNYSWASVTMLVTEQQDRFFSGFFLLSQINGTARKEEFAGVLSPDGKRFHLIEFDTHEHDEGWILNTDKIELVFLHDEEPQKIILDSLRKQ